MRIDEIIVEPDREDHIARHGVSIDEVYETAAERRQFQEQRRR